MAENGSEFRKGGDETLVILYYHYADTDVEGEQLHQEDVCRRLSLLGRVLVSGEGLNGTLAGTPRDVSAYIEDMTSRLRGMTNDDFKFSRHDGPNTTLFPDLQVRAVKELISTGGLFSQIPISETGKGYLSPEEFQNALEGSDSSNTVLLDCRNHKEILIGHFEGAIDPNTRTWSEWPAYVESSVKDWKGKQVLMYCTGGIRCEKASAFVRRKLMEAGDEDAAASVRHLKGGIHKYLEAFPDGGKFLGKNFVFDSRMAMSAAESDRQPVGQCFTCSAPHDSLAYDAVCTVCRDLVLCCTGCRARLRELHCEAHLHLADCYFTVLSGFVPEELQRQHGRLQEELNKIANGKSNRNKRRCLRNQIAKVEAALDEAGGEGLPKQQQQYEEERREEPSATSQGQQLPCRSCKLPGCSGACWGFHGRRRLKADPKKAPSSSLGCLSGSNRCGDSDGGAAASVGPDEGCKADAAASSSKAGCKAEVLCYDASHLEGRRGSSEALRVLREAAESLGAELDGEGRRLVGRKEEEGVMMLSTELPGARWLRSQGVLLWPERREPPKSKREAKRLAKAERSRDPAARAARKERRKRMEHGGHSGGHHLRGEEDEQETGALSIAGPGAVAVT